jgi:GAF domain-containing protein
LSGSPGEPFTAGRQEIVSEEKDKRIFDEQTLAKVLEAAFVLQEHNRDQKKGPDSPPAKGQRVASEISRGEQPTQTTMPAAKTGSTFTLAQIVEVQHQIQVRHLELESAMSLVVERLAQIGRASGASIGILCGDRVRYRASAGSTALPVGTEVAAQKALCAECLRTGQIFRCANIASELLLDTSECRRRGIQSMLAVPIFHSGEVVGSLELYFANPNAFTEEDVHTCQLMAGLMTEALTRDEEVGRKKSIASDRAVMLEALEKLQPNLAALIDNRIARVPAERIAVPATKSSAPVFVCRKCGHELVGEEQFCGNCGSPRSSDYEASTMQSKVASLWNMQQSMKQTPTTPLTDVAEGHEESSANLDQGYADQSLAESLKIKITELFAAAEQLGDERSEPRDLPETALSADLENSESADLEIPLQLIPDANPDVVDGPQVLEAPEVTALVKAERPVAWSSAATARDFLEQLAGAKRPGGLARFWNARRGDIYLAVAVILVLCALRWGIRSSHSVSATGKTPSTTHRRPAPDADLPLFERILVKLGLAEAPEPPEYKGNPSTHVWVDTRTALYYCPGSDLYGKTPKGKFTSQRDAQLDQFEPGYRKACD